MTDFVFAGEVYELAFQASLALARCPSCGEQ